MQHTLRKVSAEDAERVVDIFNYYVERTFAALYDAPVPREFFEKLWEMSRDLPFYVVESAGFGVVGFGLLYWFHPSGAFRGTVELALFVYPGHTRKGLGGRLLSLLLQEAKDKGVNTVLARISSRNEGSVAFHAKHGFEERGRLAAVGRKFNSPFDLLWMQKSL